MSRELAAGEMQDSLVGRDAERARIEAVLSRLDKGAQCCLVISGEPGIGKTTLLRQVEASAARRRWRTLSGTAAEFERDVPFAVLINAADDHIHSLDERFLRRACGPELARLAHVFPSLGHLTAPSLPGLQEERYRVHRALRRLLEGLAAHAPLALVLDDLHWADHETMEFVEHLVRHPVRAPVLVALAARNDALRGLDANAERLRLGPLAREAVAELAGEGLDEHTLGRLYRESGGNPFYACALADAHRSGRRAQTPLGTDPLHATVPAPVLEAVTAELDSLPADARRVLEAAAVLGDGFHPPEVAEAAELPSRDVDAALDAAARAGILVEHGPAGRLRFRHPIVRCAAYESAAPAWRRRLHARAASRLHGRGAWAHHLARSAAPGDREAIDALRQAAHAVRLTAPGSAAQWLQTALALQRDASDRERLDILVPLATALSAAGQLDASRRVLRETLPLAGAGAGAGAGPVALRGRILSALAVVEHMLGTHDAATGLLTRALDSLDEREADTPAAAELALQLAWDHLYANEIDSAARRAQQARALGRRLDDRSLAAATIGVHALTQATLGRFAVSSRGFATGLAIVSELPDAELSSHLEATLLLGYAGYHLDRLDAVIALVERGLAISRATEQGQFYVPMLLLLALTRIARGELAAADALGRDAEDVARLAHNDQWLTWSLTVQSAASTAAGDIARALAVGEEAADVGSRLTYHYFSMLARSYLAAARLEGGDPDRCVSELLAICGDPSRPPIARPFRPVPYEVLTRAEIARGNVAAAKAWARRASAAASVVPVPARRGEELRSKAASALALGDPAEAARLALAAAAVTTPAGRALDTARGHLLAGTALLATGDKAAAGDQLRRAQAGFSRCGARRLDDEAARLLRAAGRHVARGGRPAGAGRDRAALSPREREIAEHVCHGRTNREIGALLFISEKTVEGHVANLFAKLGVGRRAAIPNALATADN